MIPWLPTRLHTPSSPSWCAYSCEQWWGLKPHSTPCGNAWSMNHPKALRKPHATKNKDKNYLCFHHPQCTSTSPLSYLKSHDKPLWVKGDTQKSSLDFESTSSIMWNVKYLSGSRSTFMNDASSTHAVGREAFDLSDKNESKAYGSLLEDPISFHRNSKIFKN